MKLIPFRVTYNDLNLTNDINANPLLTYKDLKNVLLLVYVHSFSYIQKLLQKYMLPHYLTSLQQFQTNTN